MPMDNREVERQLKHKFGFETATARSADHRWYKLKLENLPVVATKFSHSRGEIGASLEAKIARQLRVSRAYFSGMIACTKSLEDYCRQIRDAPVPPWDVQF